MTGSDGHWVVPYPDPPAHRCNPPHTSAEPGSVWECNHCRRHWTVKRSGHSFRATTWAAGSRIAAAWRRWRNTRDYSQERSR